MPRTAAPFWDRVNKLPNGCWEWTGGRDRDGYGLVAGYVRRHGSTRAHRVAFLLTHGSLPAGVNVLHRCDNPPCVNPAHLFAGSIADNNRDMQAKGRLNWQAGLHAIAKGITKSGTAAALNEGPTGSATG